MPIDEIKDSYEFLEYMNKEIRYGWLDPDDKEHIDTMENFRPLYRILSIQEIMNHKLGTCIEQI